MMQATHLRELFELDPKRFEKFHTTFEDILVDYSKNLVSSEIMKELFALANEVELKDAIESMFRGTAINQTENRSVLHVALRNRSNTPMKADGDDVMPEVNKVLDQMKRFAEALQSGSCGRLLRQDHYRHCEHRYRRLRPGPCYGNRSARPYWKNITPTLYPT